MSKIIDVTTVYSEGRTQIPKPVRDILHLSSGDKVVWKQEDETIIIEKQ